MKKIILVTSDAWSMSRSSQRPSDPPYYIEDCRISAVKEIGLAGPKKDHFFCAIHKANEIGGAQAERILEKALKRIYILLLKI